MCICCNRLECVYSSLYINRAQIIIMIGLIVSINSRFFLSLLLHFLVNFLVNQTDYITNSHKDSNITSFGTSFVKTRIKCTEHG